jgi:hypothetical protein
MRVFAWMVEQLCRPLDTKVCSIANATDEADSAGSFPGYYRGA